jgi:hypothetical protein
MVGSSPYEVAEAALLVAAFPVPLLVPGVDAAFSFTAGAAFSVFVAADASPPDFSPAGVARESVR